MTTLKPRTKTRCNICNLLIRADPGKIPYLKTKPICQDCFERYKYKVIDEHGNKLTWQYSKFGERQLVVIPKK